MTSKFLEEMNREFKDFLESAPEDPPKDIQNNIYALVCQELNPNAWQLFSKMALIHLFVGLGTLGLCPQFGLRLFGDGMGLMWLFLPFGAYGCTALCGAFFVGTSLFVLGIILRPEEVKIARNHRWLQISALTFISLGAFVMADAEILLAFALAWIVGSIIGGAAMLEFGRYLRLRSSHPGPPQT